MGALERLKRLFGLFDFHSIIVEPLFDPRCEGTVWLGAYFCHRAGDGSDVASPEYADHEGAENDEAQLKPVAKCLLDRTKKMMH